MQDKNLFSSRRDFLRGSLVLASGLVVPLSGYGAMMEDKGEFDVVIYGGTSAAITAAVQVRRMGKSVVVVCPDKHLGGLTSSGLGWTDSKNGNAIGGLSREFYHRVWKFYQNSDRWTRETRKAYLDKKIGAQPGRAIEDDKEVMWTFEPYAAEKVMEDWLAEEKVPVFKDEWLDRKKGVEKKGNAIVAITMLSGKKFRGKMFIDAGYEGDLMAAAGVKYRIGRDTQREYQEPLNGIRFPVKGIDRSAPEPKDEYPGIDPYVVPGNPASGLIAGIEEEIKGAMPIGEADPVRLQSFNFRLALTQLESNRRPFPKPEGYDVREYELLFRLFEAGKDSGFTTQLMPNLKTDSNNEGRMSGDYIGGNFSVKEGWTYSEADYKQREEIVEAHRRYQLGLLWTMQNHERTPAKKRTMMASWGLAKDEFIDNDNWPYQVYVREARRMQGMTMVTQHHVQLKPGYEVKDSIGMGSYSLDSHTVRRVVVDGFIRNEGGFYIWWDKPYALPYGCMVPRWGDVTNLFAPTTLSATHAAFGSIRMEPTYMILGQSSATAAVLAIEKKVPVQMVPYSELAKRLVADGQRLTMAETLAEKAV